MSKKSTFVFMVILLAVLLTIALTIRNVILEKPLPMFSLNEKGFKYQIKKEHTEINDKEISTYWIEQIKKGEENTKRGINNRAIKINGADFNLDNYLDQEVEVNGTFSIQHYPSGANEDVYYLTSVKKVQ